MSNHKREMTVLAALEAVTPETAAEIATLSPEERDAFRALAEQIDQGGALMSLVNLLTPTPSTAPAN